MGQNRDLSKFDSIDFEAARARIEGVVQRTELMPLDVAGAGMELRLKMENRQVAGAFKARGAWNNIQRLTPEQRKAGVVCTSSGNHGKALAWAAAKGGVSATIVMPDDAYPNKIAACREAGATVHLAPGRMAAEELCGELVASGLVLVHPYDMQGTVEGAGTVGLEIAEQWPEVDCVLIPVGGGGLAAGVSLALRRKLGWGVSIFGVEPSGAASMSLGLAAGAPVILEDIETKVQGLCPPDSGALNISILGCTLDRMWTLPDAPIFAAQKTLARAGETVEVAGAASLALALDLQARGLLPEVSSHPLRVVAIVSGGNPDPAQFASLLEDSPK
jgi:threonine dehydratase